MICARCPFTIPCWSGLGDLCECPDCFQTIFFAAHPLKKSPGGMALIGWAYVFTCDDLKPIDHRDESHVGALYCPTCARNGGAFREEIIATRPAANGIRLTWDHYREHGFEGEVRVLECVHARLRGS